MQIGAVARRGVPLGARTRPFTLQDLDAALRDPPTHTVYVETDASGYVVGSRGESAATVALSARGAASGAARAALAPCGGGLYLEVTAPAGVPPHHDLTLHPPLYLMLLPSISLQTLPALAATDYIGVGFPLSYTGGGREAEGSRAAVTGAGATGSATSGHECRYCGRRYSRRYGLRIHERTHTGARPLACPHCARPFADPSNLNKHVRLHLRDAAAAGPPRRRDPRREPRAERRRGVPGVR